MRKDCISIICELVLNEKELTTKVLNENGITSREISKLIEVGFLAREKRGLYVLNRWEFMFDFGKNLLIKGEFDKAKSCFRVLCRDDESYRVSSFDRLSNFIIDNKYDEAAAILEVMCEVDDIRFNKKINLYLLLLNELELIPEHLKERAGGLQLEDLTGDEPPEEYLEDETISKIFNRQFACAKKEMVSKNKIKCPYGEVIGKLLDLIVKKRLSYEKELACQKRYVELIDFLEGILAVDDMTSNEMASLHILKDFAMFKIMRDDYLIPEY